MCWTSGRVDLLGDAAPHHIGGEAFLRGGRDDALLRRHPALTVAAQNDQERPAAPDLGEAHLRHLSSRAAASGALAESLKSTHSRCRRWAFRTSSKAGKTCVRRWSLLSLHVRKCAAYE
jgi:hypothetical protein